MCLGVFGFDQFQKLEHDIHDIYRERERERQRERRVRLWTLVGCEMEKTSPGNEFNLTIAVELELQ
jgi:hypothetical protein